MTPLKSRMLGTTFIPAVIAAGVMIAVQAPPVRANPCAARKAQSAANPCAARNPCAAANPCAARNPCAAASPCAAGNPCSARNPCSPCAAKASASSRCVVPRLQRAAKRNPCAARNPCNPCAARNPCNPCAANPCGASQTAELKALEARAAYKCMKPTLTAGYRRSGNRFASSYVMWRTYNTRPYPSSTHGSRLVNNYANTKAKNYRRFEKSGRMPKGAVLAKDSFLAHPNGRISAGPFFLMEKMGRGFSRASGDWRYTLILPNGRVVGTTGGRGSKNVKFCYECHMSVAEEQDSMMFLPQEVRRR